MSKYGGGRYGAGIYSSGEDHPAAGTAGKVMWMVQVDWDNDGVFGSLIESQKILSISIKRGRRQRMRADGKGQLQPGSESGQIRILDNEGRLDSLNSSSPLNSCLGLPGLLARILIVSKTYQASGAQVVFTGCLSNITYDHRAKTALITLDGLSKYLQTGKAAALYAPCQSIPGYDSCFILNSTAPTPYPFNYWKGRAAGLYLSSCAQIVLGESGWPFGLHTSSGMPEAEQTEYFYFSGESAWEALKELADGFAARLFFRRDGSLFIMDHRDRVGLFSGTPPGGALTGFGLERGSPLYSLRNAVIVQVRTHSVPMFTGSAAYTRVWFNAGPIEVSPGTTRDILVRYPDGLDVPSQGSFANCPVSGYSANSHRDKSGVEMGAAGTGEAVYWLVHPQAAGGGADPLALQKFAAVRLQNNSSLNTAYFFNISLELIGITETGSMTEKVQDTDSQALNGVRSMSLSSRWIQDQDSAISTGKAYMLALGRREQASPSTLTYFWRGDELFSGLQKFDTGSSCDFGPAGGETSLQNYGLYGRRLITGQELSWPSPDGQSALVKLTYEMLAPARVEAGNHSSSCGANTSSLSWNHTVQTGSDRMLVVTLSKRSFSAGEVSSITFGTQALSRLQSASYAAGNNPQVEIWYLLAPAVGTQAVTITLGAGDWIEAGAVDLRGVNQLQPFGTPVTARGPAGIAGGQAASAYGGLVIDVLGYYHNNTLPGAGTGQTRLWALTSDLNWKGASSIKDGSSLTELSWSVPNFWVWLGAGVNGDI